MSERSCGRLLKFPKFTDFDRSHSSLQLVHGRRRPSSMTLIKQFEFFQWDFELEKFKSDAISNPLNRLCECTAACSMFTHVNDALKVPFTVLPPHTGYVDRYIFGSSSSGGGGGGDSIGTFQMSFDPLSNIFVRVTSVIESSRVCLACLRLVY